MTLFNDGRLSKIRFWAF